MSAWVESPFFGIALTIVAYWAGVRIQKKTGLVICNAMLLAVLMVITVLTVFHIPYDAYNQGGSIINMIPMGGDFLVEIHFEKTGMKKLMLRAAAQHMSRE